MEQQINVLESDIHISDSQGNRQRFALGGPLAAPGQEITLADPDAFAEALKAATAVLNRNRPLLAVLPDTLFFCRVLQFDRIPLSLRKRDELIQWRMAGYLPGKPGAFVIRYQVFGDRVLTIAVPRSLHTEVCDRLEQHWNGCYRLVSETVRMMDLFQHDRNGQDRFLILRREGYFSGLVIQKGQPVLVRTRKFISGVSIETEIDTMEKLMEAEGISPGGEPELIGRTGDDVVPVDEGWTI